MPTGAETLPVHFLHISKAGGSALKQVLFPFIRSHDLVFRNHWHYLHTVPEGEKAFFVVRDPPSRFVSAFNSRLRMGRPKFDNPWTEPEKVFFAHFPTANALAEALTHEDEERRALAAQAMAGIGHVNLPMRVWLTSPEYLERRQDSILLAAFQHRLNEDFELLKPLLGLPADLELPADPVAAHATPEGFDTALSDLGRRNVLTYYARDVRIYEYLAAARFGTRAPVL